MGNPDKLLLSVIIPVYNEELTVVDVIERVKKVMLQIGLRNEIIIVDDCSVDRSLEFSRSSGVKVYSLKKHMGKGYALKAGFAMAKGDLIATIDSDGSHNPEELPRLLAPILQDQADFVIGSRFLDQKPAENKKFNELGVHLFNILIYILTSVGVSDSQSGYRVMKSAAVKGSSLKSGGYEIESEMLLKAAQKGFRVREVPISFVQRTYGKSRLDPVADGLKILRSIILGYMKVDEE